MAQALSSEKPSEKRHAVPRRSAFEVRMDVLKVVTAGFTKPTQIMCRSNTSWIVLQKILESLLASGLLRQTKDRSRVEYAVTDRGIAVVRDYHNLLGAARAGDAGSLSQLGYHIPAQV